ncbi:hypothetical protein CON36_25610 [Bacillus cereus]|uniref:Uncharacterized protein n=2 Tax=Bacillus cereus TaxID=1396 RepID=A0A9X6SW76_BACCE|nr:hypothetical protein CON36_25610 [Bacillus cereus]PEU54216.1 hypothetical protein CN405_23425 [Bacillus cereus]PFJ28752.1 hypothetical protein COI90_24410 [Bacillus cereus]PFO27073.1 hypothetical protein COJ80_05630 [Bacillus cereus]PGN78176.1 hypothetical protein CN964_04150 [Bacillus cereus]
MMVRVLTQPEPGWQRIDDSDRNIIFEGENWFSGYSKYSDNYLKTFHYKSSSQPSNSVQIKFSFVGTKLRLIGLVNNGGYDRYATIVIDGNTERLDYDAWEGTRQAVIYEKTNLNKGPHTVTILGTYLNLDAIDIDSDGYVFTPKKVGEILDKPDPGWNRFDDADSLIKYGDGAWNRFTDDRYYNSTAVYSLTKSVVEFSFKGTGVRLVSKSVNLGYGPVDITIDGVKESYNPVLGSDNWKVLLYNKEGLKNEFHSVKLEGPEGIIMDAIDILDGELVKTAKVGDVLLQPETGWKRIDDTDVNIKYRGVWKNDVVNSSLYNSTCHYKAPEVDNNPASIRFDFEGTKLRIIALTVNPYDSDAKILIDGREEVINFSSTDTIYQRLVYENLNLPQGVHKVEIKGLYINLDAIDIDETGSMIKPPVEVGDVLLQPEDGWKRFDDSDSLIKYSGTWTISTPDDSGYNRTVHWTGRTSAGIVSATFAFYGTSLRIIGLMTEYYQKGIITIDGITNDINFNRTGVTKCALLYEELNLVEGKHIVTISGEKINLDAIDIDNKGYLVKQAEVGDVLNTPESGWTRHNYDSKLSSEKRKIELLPQDVWKTFEDYTWTGVKNVGQIRFKFFGTAFRIISRWFSDATKSAKVTIDGMASGTFAQYGDPKDGLKLCYEKMGLSKGIHSVVIDVNENMNLTLCAVDLLGADYFVDYDATIGEVITIPEVGWKRIEDSNSNFKYTGDGWATHSDAKWSGGSTHYCPNSDKLATVEFVFNGTKLRIIGLLSAGYREGQIWIDEQPVETINFEQPNAQYQSLVYEKLGLANGEHKVKLSGLNINFDAIDIDSDGSIERPPAKVGDQLPQPEPGWKRMDDADSNIRYDGKWNFITTQKGAYNETLHYYSAPSGSTEEASATFKFKGTKLRLVALSSYFQKKAILKIDGVSYDLTKVEGRPPIYGIQQTLMFEATGLEDKEHLVELSGIDITLDAIDIDKTGSIVKPNPPAKVGDILLQPEPGWTRVDDTNPLIHYRGDYWELAKGGGYEPGYNKTATYRVPDHSNRTLGTVEFSFKGTGLRVISANYSQSSWEDVTIEIDGVTEKYKVKTPTDQDKTRYQVILYEKNLPNGVHTVKLTGTLIAVDAFDIKSGDLVETPTNLRDVLFEPQPGWQRIDDTDSNIEYNGVWATSGADGRCYNKTIHYKHASSNIPPDSNPVSIKFNFTGTKLRIIGIGLSEYDSGAKILIDGVEETINFFRPSGLTAIYQSLIYEKLGLSNKLHTVEIKGKYINLDAIDIDESGSIGGKPSVKIGDQLKQPEAGWKRLDGTDSLLKYQGTWEKGSSSDWYNGTYHYVKDNDSKGAVEFDFYGTQLRIITCFDVASYRTDDISITIDGVTEKYSEIASAKVYQGLAYEKLGLTKGKHRVRIQCGTKGTYRLNIDAIDIDADGYIEKPPITVGDFLATPEDGWKRFTKENMYFDYTGGMDYQNQTPPIKYSFDKIQFRFFGTKFRLIYSSNLGSNEKQLGHVLIDGVKYPVNMFPVSGPAKVACEVLNLDEGYHMVTVNGGTHEGWDPQFIGVDIDATGHIDRLPVSIGDVSTYPNYGWKRYDDNSTYIQYDANWSKNVAYNGAYGGKSTCAKKGKNASMVFKFKGTKLRLIVGCATNQYYSDRIRVKIDDLPEEYFDAIAPQDTNQVLKYEKLGLEDIEHDVTVTVITTQPGALEYDFRMDAIDIDDTGSLVSRPGVGTVLTEPEKGWKRIDDTDPLIRYIGNWKLTTGNDKHYNKTTHYNLDKKLDTSFEFEFVGTKLRLLAYGDSGYDATSKVLIDGKEETMVYNSPSGNQVIRYEKIGLDRGKHTVKVIGKAMSLDSIDIDADGYLLARLGDKLVEPEPGWVRFDDTHKNIEYNGFWKTTEADVSCYNNTHHWKSKEDNNDSTISARFLFKGTKFRLISMTSPSYPEDIELKIDGQKEILKLSGEVMQYQTLAYEKKNLEDMIHVIELSGKYISIDAIDLEEGATLLKLPDEKLKPYQIRSGLIFKDNFDTFDSRWIASPVGSYSLIDRKGYFRMLHNVSRDTLLLADLPNEKEFAFEVSADYTPTHEDDKGGIIVWKNGEENIEFLETEDGTRETTELKWMACKDNEDWTFFSDYGEGFNFYDSDRMNCSKFGVVLKKGSNSKFVNLDIDSIIATRGRKLTIANIAPNISVEMEDEFGRIIFNGNTGYNTGIQITLPSLEFAGKVILKNVEGKELGVIKTTFYGGDVYGFGSNLEIKFSGEELSTLAQTRLPDMISGKSEIMLELVNPSVARANNVNLSIAQYEDKFGWSWADLALDSNGKPGQYQDSINIPYVNPEKTIKFWLKVTKGTDYVGLAPLQFQIHLEHE